jgi:hypothetical protein
MTTTPTGIPANDGTERAPSVRPSNALISVDWPVPLPVTKSNEPSAFASQA